MSFRKVYVWQRRLRTLQYGLESALLLGRNLARRDTNLNYAGCAYANQYAAFRIFEASWVSPKPPIKLWNAKPSADAFQLWKTSIKAFDLTSEHWSTISVEAILASCNLGPIDPFRHHVDLGPESRQHHILLCIIAQQSIKIALLDRRRRCLGLFISMK